MKVMPVLRHSAVIPYNDLPVAPAQVERILGTEKSHDREMTLAMIEEMLQIASGICDVRYDYAVYDKPFLDPATKTLSVGDTEFSIGKIIFGQVKRSESMAIFLCTAGKKIGELARELIREKDFLRGYILDIAGSEIVEAAADFMQDNLRLEAGAHNKKITNRFSPGYCGWHVSEQHRLFSLIPENRCGITLLESSLMDPIKSISGIIGLGENVRYADYTCSLCDQQNCVYRKQKDK